MALLRRNYEGGVVYEVDFTSLTSVSDLGEGSVSIAGRTWYIWNNAGANKCQIVNGSGVRLYGAGTVGNNQAGTQFGMDLGQLFGGVTYSTGFELWADVAYSGTIPTWTQYTAMAMGLGNVPTSDTNDNNMLMVLPNIAWSESGEGARAYENWITNGATTLATDTSAPAIATPRTWVVRAEGTGFNLYYGTPATAPAWPDKSSLTLLATRTTGVTRTYSSTLFGPRFMVTLDADDYLEIQRLRVLRVWSGD